MSYETRYAAMKKQQFDDRSSSEDATRDRVMDRAARKLVAFEQPVDVTMTPDEFFLSRERYAARVDELRRNVEIKKQLVEKFPKITFKNAEAAIEYVFEMMSAE